MAELPKGKPEVCPAFLLLHGREDGMHWLLSGLMIFLFIAGCGGSSHHNLAQFPHTYPVRIDCAGCHKDPRGRFTHGKGWCDDHFKLRRHNAKVCSKCHEDVQCRNCHRDPRTNEIVWSAVRQNRWYLKRDGK
jgi:hypothetical protein